MGVCQVEGRVALLHQNIPNMIGQITSAFAKNGYNISDLTNKSKGSKAYTLIDIESKASEQSCKRAECHRRYFKGKSYKIII